MVFSRCIKRPVEILYKKLASPVQSGHGYTTLACKGSTLGDFQENKSALYSNYGFEIPFKRCYSLASSEQMNLIKQLRERTSAPIKEVKSALTDCNWDIDEAQKELRKRGVVLASKKSSRNATEGLLAFAQNDQKASVIELNCETDFVARNEIFQYLALSLAKLSLLVEGSQSSSSTSTLGPDVLENVKMIFDHPKLHGEKTVQTAISEVAAIMGENVKLRRGFSMANPSNGVLSSYLHTTPQPGLGRIAGLVSLEVEDNNVSFDRIKEVGSDIAMHIVASKPLFLTKELVSVEAIENEREILKARAESTGKPKMAIEKMVEGRLRKYFEEVVLMEQKFVVNDSITVKTLLDNLSKEVGSPVKVTEFLRIEVGEGLQRVETSSTSEPLAQAA